MSERFRLSVLLLACLLMALSGQAADRLVRDTPVSLDLSEAQDVSFSLDCDTLTPFYKFVCHFKSGNGWYGTEFDPGQGTGTRRVTVERRKTSPEGVTEGWKNITCVRVTGWGAKSGEATISVSDISSVRKKPDVLVVYAESLASVSASSEYMTYASNVAGTLNAAGVTPLVVADVDLTAAALQTAPAVVLPYNPDIPQDVLSLLEDYVHAGGRLLVCYSFPT